MLLCNFFLFFFLLAFEFNVYVTLTVGPIVKNFSLCS